MSRRRWRMFRRPIPVILVIATILFIELYESREKLVKMATVPGKPNVQKIVSLLQLMTALQGCLKPPGGNSRAAQKKKNESQPWDMRFK